MKNLRKICKNVVPREETIPSRDAGLRISHKKIKDKQLNAFLR